MMTLLVILLIAVVVGLGWVYRVQIAAKVTGQSEERIRRYLERRKRG
jgi:hypothetical protein